MSTRQCNKRNLLTHIVQLNSKPLKLFPEGAAILPHSNTTVQLC
uniref:Uncharacterized protein n=1 Tax=Arundo donax TaxID=35708 RepID=A0A0A8YLN4_ARUDO